MALNYRDKHFCTVTSKNNKLKNSLIGHSCQDDVERIHHVRYKLVVLHIQAVANSLDTALGTSQVKYLLDGATVRDIGYCPAGFVLWAMVTLKQQVSKKSAKSENLHFSGRLAKAAINRRLSLLPERYILFVDMKGDKRESQFT